MGPCRVDPFGEGPQKGVCGADADIIVARNLGRTVAAGAAAHSDHGRDILEVFESLAAGETSGYEIRDEAKLLALAKEWGIEAGDRSIPEVARDLADAMLEDFGSRKQKVGFLDRLPEQRRKLFEELHITPRGIDRENVEMLHRTHMGVDNDYANTSLHALRTSLSDGWGGSMIATELSDVMFGTPAPCVSRVNLGALKPECVNIALHGHNPLLSDVIMQAAGDPELIELAKQKGAEGINLVGLCCTGNELQMRKGIPMAGNHLMQELVLLTGALDAMVVDYQCIMPSLGELAACYHTLFFSTSPKAKFPRATHLAFTPETGAELGHRLVALAVENFARRQPDRVYLPTAPVAQISGFSLEALLGALGGSLDPLLTVIKAGQIRGAVGVVGCNNPKVKHDFGHVSLTRRLIENDILVLDTGCAAVANAKAGFKAPSAADLAGPGLREVCRALGIPPVLHTGSCVDNTRILTVLTQMVEEGGLGDDIDQVPAVGLAPEWMSEKALSIGTYFVASGVYVIFGTKNPVSGSEEVMRLISEGWESKIGGKLEFILDPKEQVQKALEHIDKKRAELGLPEYDPARFGQSGDIPLAAFFAVPPEERNLYSRKTMVEAA